MDRDPLRRRHYVGAWQPTLDVESVFPLLDPYTDDWPALFDQGSRVCLERMVERTYYT